jgi:hypothetical protein
VETVVALAVTAFVALLLVLTAINAGPLWRDEVNTANVAQSASLKELWGNLSFESFPLLWPLLLRGCDFLGLTGSDMGIRVLGLCVGLFFLASLWLCSRWIGSRAPILSIALMGSLPAFIFTVGANRAYGLASCLLVLCFGTLWRVVELPSRARVFWAGLACFLFAQCVYYDVIFLAAMLAGGAMVALRRRQWKALGALVGIGAVSGASLAIYPFMFHRGTPTAHMIEAPSFNFSILWNRFGAAVAARSSAQLDSNGPEAWFWVVLLLGGLAVALMMQRTRARRTQNQEPAATVPGGGCADLSLFCAVSMMLGVSVYFAFLLRLHYWTQSWYYVEMLCLCAVSLDGLLGANRPALCPWGLLRIGFAAAVMAWGASSVWEEAHTRRSNVDLIAATLNKNATDKDLIVVQSAWDGITFNRYYHGRARWMTVPPIDSHLVHRNDLALEKMSQELNRQEPMAPVLLAITNTLRGGDTVWLVGKLTENLSIAHPRPSPSSGLPLKWLGTYLDYWSWQVTIQLLDHARQKQVLEIPAGKPVCCLENLPLTRFSGYKPGADGPEDAGP